MQIFLNRLNHKQNHIRKTEHEKTNTNTKEEEGQTLELDGGKSMWPPSHRNLEQVQKNMNFVYVDICSPIAHS